MMSMLRGQVYLFSHLARLPRPAPYMAACTSLAAAGVGGAVREEGRSVASRPVSTGLPILQVPIRAMVGGTQGQITPLLYVEYRIHTDPYCKV